MSHRTPLAVAALLLVGLACSGGPEVASTEAPAPVAPVPVAVEEPEEEKWSRYVNPKKRPSFHANSTMESSSPSVRPRPLPHL